MPNNGSLSPRDSVCLGQSAESYSPQNWDSHLEGMTGSHGVTKVSLGYLTPPCMVMYPLEASLCAFCHL